MALTTIQIDSDILNYIVSQKLVKSETYRSVLHRLFRRGLRNNGKMRKV